MTTDPREEAIRRAYEEAKFDERAPDEKGFAEIFELELKPALVSAIGFNLSANDARKRRRRTGSIIMILVAILLLPVTLLLNTSNGKLTEAVFYVIIFAWILVWTWAFKKRPSDEDPNHAAAVEAVLRRFDCRIGTGAAPHHPQFGKPPVFPEYTKLDIQSEHILGEFDRHVRFAAVRVVASKKEGKHTREKFRGWYLRVDLPFEFPGTTVIRERQWLGNMVVERGLKELRDVDLEDPSFRRRYSVISTDQVEARVILAPDVIHHLAEAKTDPSAFCGMTIAFHGAHAYLWLPSRATALSDWRPLDPRRLIEDIHEAFAEMASMRAFLRDIDVIAESEGFRAQAARNTSPITR